MLNKFRASLEEAEVIKDRNLALDFIGKRGSIENAGRVRCVFVCKDWLGLVVCRWGLGWCVGPPKTRPRSLSHTLVYMYTYKHQPTYNRRSASSTPS